MRIDPLHLAEHTRLQQLLSAFALAVDEHNWVPASALLEDFIVLFEAHLSEEERVLLPSSSCAVEQITVILQQHRRLRMLLGRLRAKLSSPQRLSKEQVTEFAFSWSLHDEYEQRVLSVALPHAPAP